MITRWKWTALTAGLGFAQALMGVNSCSQTEVCDGIDNDHDGEVDEDFDQDSDGYTSCGGDCDDERANVYPYASEVQDGLDNDCDGNIDESSNVYTFTFLARHSNLPVAGVPVWLGLQGDSPIFWSDEEGKVRLELDSPYLTWSFGYVYQRTFSRTYEYRRIYSFLGDSLEPEQTFYITDPNLVSSEDVTFISGEIDGVDTSAPDSVVFATLGNSNGATELAMAPEAERLYYGMEYGAPTFLMATQNPYSPSFEYDNISIPLAFNLALGPTDPTNLTLDRHFDQRMKFRLSNLDSRMTSTWHDLELVFPAGAGSFFVSDESWPLESLESEGIATPALSGPLARSTITVRPSALSADGRLAQLVRLEGQTDPNAVLDVEMPPIHKVGPYEPLTAESLPGTAIDFYVSQEMDRRLAYYINAENGVDVSHSIRHYWWVYQYASDAPVTFPKIPAGALPWGEERDPQGTYETVLEMASSSVTTGIYDSEAGYRESWVSLDTQLEVATAPAERSSSPALAPRARRPHFKQARELAGGLER